MRPPVRLVLDGCLDADRDAIEHAVRVELGDPHAEPVSAVDVLVACAPGGVEAGVILEVRPPDNPRRYRYALDWRAQPGDARPRLLGLAVAEAVDASRIELTAVPDPPVAPGATPVVVAPPPSRDWAIALVTSQRSFTATSGLSLGGVGLMPSWRLSPRGWLAIDLVAETQAIAVTSGAIDVLSVSAAPRALVRAGGRLHAALGAGARVGVTRMRSKTMAGTGLVGSSLVRPWLGPVATLAFGLDLTSRIAVGAELEVGVVASGTTAREFGRPVGVLDGTWTSWGLSATLTL